MKNSETKTALITGASSGIGKEIARVLAQKSYNLVISSRNIKKQEAVKKEFENDYNITVTIIPADFSKPNASQKLFDECQKLNITIDVLVNNAGFALMTEDYFGNGKKVTNLLNAMVVAPSVLSSLFANQMIKRKKGYILNVASISAYSSLPNLLSYGAIKRYILQYSMELHYQLKKHNINVSCVVPGPVKTAFFTEEYFEVSKLAKKVFLYPIKKVTNKAVRGMFKNRIRIIPGFGTKIIVFILRIFPKGLLFRIMQWFEKRRVKMIARHLKKK